MIEDEELGLKIAEDPKEKMIIETIEKFEKSLIVQEINIEIDKKTLEFLKSKVKEKE